LVSGGEFGQLFAKKNNLNWKNFFWKGFLYVFLPCFVLFWFFVAYGHYRPAIKEYFYNKRGEAIFAQIEAQKKANEALERADTFGGKTPEETIDLFISALKVGDIELASKYYDVRVQKDALASLKKEMSLSGNYNNSLNYFDDVRKKGTKVCGKEVLSCTLKYEYRTAKENISTIVETGQKIIIPSGSIRTKAIAFKLNQYSIVWKISDPI
jgi:hypothetical protein